MQSMKEETKTPSDQVITTEEVVNPEKELKYQKAVNFMESLRCMTACKDKVKMYKKVSEQFAALSGYKDADSRMKKCKRNAKKTKEDIKKIIYDKAQYHKSNARSAVEYNTAASEFRKIKGYLDADELASVCDQLSNNIERRGVKKTFLSAAVALLCIFLLVFSIATPYTKYIVANLSMNIGSYQLATSLYDRLDTYKDSEEKLIESKYLYGLELEAKGEYVKAEILFSKLGDYKDSLDKEANIEKQVIKNSVIGDIVSVGNVKWIVIDMKDNQALLLKKKELSRIPYHDKTESVVWESSTLRNYLNSEYLTSTFSTQERKNIVLSTVGNTGNDAYHTEGGNDTKDYIFILSIEEISKYKEYMPVLKSNTWLRNPGYDSESAAFLATNGTTMDYGYLVTSDQIGVLPAIWFDIN